jgi:hypothetical protein
MTGKGALAIVFTACSFTQPRVPRDFKPGMQLACEDIRGAAKADTAIAVGSAAISTSAFIYGANQETDTDNFLPGLGLIVFTPIALLYTISALHGWSATARCEAYEQRLLGLQRQPPTPPENPP